MKIYFDFNDWWIGYYRGPDHHYLCLLPTLVVRVKRKKKWPQHYCPRCANRVASPGNCLACDHELTHG